MVSVRHPSTDEYGWITLHGLPIPFYGSGVPLEQSLAFFVGQAVRVLPANVNRRATNSIQELAHVGLAPATAQRFVIKYELRIGVDPQRRNEEPLALPNERVSLAAVAFLPLALPAAFEVSDEFRLQCFLGGDHAADRSSFGNARNKPVAFVMPAEEFILGVGQAVAFSGLADHQQKVAILRLNVENFDVGIVSRLDVEEFATAVIPDVDHDWTRSLTPMVRHQRADLGSCAEFLEFGLDEVCVHEELDTDGAARVRKSGSRSTVCAEWAFGRLSGRLSSSTDFATCCVSTTCGFGFSRP